MPQREWTPEGWKTIGGSSGGSSPFSSPSAEAKANDAGLAADAIDGTGSGGKITVKDVENAAKVAAAPTPPDAEPEGDAGE